MSLDHEALMKTSNDHHRRLSSLSSLDDPLVSFFEGSASPKDLGIQHSPSNTKRARARSVANGAISLTATVLEENGRLQLELQRLRTPSSSSSPSTNPTFKRHVAEIQRLREELSVTETQLQVTAMQLEEATLMYSNENQNNNNNELSRLRQTLSVTEMHLENSTTQQQKQSRLHKQEVATLTERLQVVEQHAIEATQEAATASAKAVAAATTPSPSIEFFERQLKKMKNKLMQATNALAKKTLDLDSALYTIENESIRIENIEQNNLNREEKRVTSIMLKTKTLIKKMKQNHGNEMSELKKQHEQLIHQHVLNETQQGKTTKLAIKQAVSIAVKATTSALREKQQHKFETLANELAKTSAFAGNLSEINDQLREKLMR